ncbi:MAG: hypothetical protein LQ343_007674 [Gyalolechia ehrenbergii]|nr:MAG: hypothetical protein LQ343_007674 [Gyalolechia ehrenbergii]
MIGCGSMGGGMALLFAEHGITVSLNDPSEETMDQLINSAKKDGLQDRLKKYGGYQDLCSSLGSPKIFVFSLPHGTVGDTVVEGLHPYLDKGDVIIDASNENWQNTQRRQGKLVPRGVYYIGMGVSGGYQAARRGPSVCPGGEERALEIVMPLLQQVAAKDSNGNPCVRKVGTGGSGHYVKMVHNGIEHGMMSALAEAWQIMNLGLKMGYDEIADEFARWDDDGELRGTFLVSIGADISRQKDNQDRYVLSIIEDKVVQDVDGTEGTGIWSQLEAVRLHVPAPSLTTAHFIRLASAFRANRKQVKAAFGGQFSVQPWDEASGDKKAVLENIRRAVYAAFLASFVEGLNIIDQADQENHWSIDYAAVTQIWRNGCIIKADYITDMLADIFKNPHADKDLLHNAQIAQELKNAFPALKKIVAQGVQHNAVIPSLSATLEFLKYSTNTLLPTQFQEAQLDYFGKHMFDLKSEPEGKPETGKHHFEWKLA